MIYLIRVKPFTTRKLNNLELFNESTILMCTLLSMQFTETENRLESDGVGWLHILVVGLNVLANIGLIFGSMLKQIILKVKEFITKRNMG